MAKSTIHRIKEYIDYKRISVRLFEKSISMSNGSFASQLKNDKTIGVDKVENILNVYSEINPDWLLTGIGSMLRSVTLSPAQAAPAAPAPQAPDTSSMHYIMQRYESLIAENALLKKEVEELKQSRGTRINTPAYTISEKIDAHLAAEPGAHK